MCDTELSNLLGSLNVEDIETQIQLLGLENSARVISSISDHSDYPVAGGMLLVKYIRLMASKTILEFAEKTKKLIKREIYDFIQDHHQEIDEHIEKMRSYEYKNCTYFSIRTMIKSFLFKYYNGDIVESISMMWMRIALEMYHKEGIEAVFNYYDDIIYGYYTPASPIIFNSGFKHSQLSSCFLVRYDDDMDNIVESNKIISIISSKYGGLGIDLSRIRHSVVRNIFQSAGVPPLLREIDKTVEYISQGGLRKGAATIFLSAWHIDIEQHIACKSKQSVDYLKTINIGIWMPWLFWKRFIAGESKWSLFSPDHVPKLLTTFGPEFEQNYLEYEQHFEQLVANGVHVPDYRVIDIKKFFNSITTMQRDSGMPYIMNGDSCNLKSNHRKLGLVSSNLCLEIVQYCTPDEISSCNLHSFSLKEYVTGKVPSNTINNYGPVLRKCFDFRLLGEKTRMIVRTLDVMIDINKYPLEDNRYSNDPQKIRRVNESLRPLGIGCSGFSDMLARMDLTFTDNATKYHNKLVFACIYFNALIESITLSIKKGPYAKYEGSPISEGKLQFDLWKEEFELLGPNEYRKKEDDEPVDPSEWGQEITVLENGHVIYPTWESLKAAIREFKVRNSLLIGLMPTASTANIRSNCESFEAHQTNLYNRKTSSGSFMVINEYLVSDLAEIGLWNKTTSQFLQYTSGSIKNFHSFVYKNQELFQDYDPINHDRLLFIESKYRTMWEIPQSVFLKLAADRGRYVDQSQSLNVYFSKCNDKNLELCFKLGYLLGNKTINYYVRSKNTDANVKIAVDSDFIKRMNGISFGKGMYSKVSICSACQ